MSSDAAVIIRAMWEKHNTAVSGGELGVGVPFQVFYCTTCTEPYPCSTAREIVKYGALNPEYEFLSLRAPVKGEEVNLDSPRRARLDGHSWSIGSANPTYEYRTGQ